MADSAIVALADEVIKMRRALAFYANEENWLSPSRGFAMQYDPDKSEVQKDRGACARKALED